MYCKGLTLTGGRCHRRTKHEYCFQHSKNTVYRQPKPDSCAVCYESLATERRALKCGHWIHKKCIILSAKAECPLCKTPMNFNRYDMNKIKKLAQKRAAENLAEEEQELMNELQFQITSLISPVFQQTVDEFFMSMIGSEGVLDYEDYQEYQDGDVFTGIFEFIPVDPDDMISENMDDTVSENGIMSC